MPAPTPNQITPEQIAKNYSACLDSVNLINDIVAYPTKDQRDVDTVVRNTRHLKIMLAKTYWTTQDLTPLRTASEVVITVTSTV